MFGWFRKYVRKIGIFGVEVEFHPPTEMAAPATPPAPPKPAELTKLAEPSMAMAEPPLAIAAPVHVAVPRTVSRPAETHQTGTASADKTAFLAQVKDKTNGEAERVDDYERVLDDLIAWSEAQGGLLTFWPRPKTNTQATVTYRFRGLVFWNVWPQKQKPTKFTYDYDFDRANLLAEFAKLSPDVQPASETVPTVWFRDLVPDVRREKLKQLLAEVLRRLASQSGTHMVVLYVDEPAKKFTITARMKSARLPGVDKQMEESGFKRTILAEGLEKGQAEEFRDRVRADYISKGYQYQTHPQLS